MPLRGLGPEAPGHGGLQMEQKNFQVQHLHVTQKSQLSDENSSN